jgi:hypothetical protein
MYSQELVFILILESWYVGKCIGNWCMLQLGAPMFLAWENFFIPWEKFLFIYVHDGQNEFLLFIYVHDGQNSKRHHACHIWLEKATWECKHGLGTMHKGEAPSSNTLSWDVCSTTHLETHSPTHLEWIPCIDKNGTRCKLIIDTTTLQATCKGRSPYNDPIVDFIFKCHTFLKHISMKAIDNYLKLKLSGMGSSRVSSILNNSKNNYLINNRFRPLTHLRTYTRKDPW